MERVTGRPEPHPLLVAKARERSCVEVSWERGNPSKKPWGSSLGWSERECVWEGCSHSLCYWRQKTSSEGVQASWGLSLPILGCFWSTESGAGRASDGVSQEGTLAPLTLQAGGPERRDGRRTVRLAPSAPRATSPGHLPLHLGGHRGDRPVRSDSETSVPKTAS